MEKKDFIQLLERVADGVATDQEMALYLKWYNSFEVSDDLWKELNEGPEAFKKELLLKIEQEAGLGNTEQIEPLKTDFKLWRWIAAAAVILVISAGVYFFNGFNSTAGKGSQMVSRHDDIKPGKNVATLRLANGKTITLSDAQSGVVVNANKLSYNDGTLVEPANKHLPDGKILNQTIATPRGGTYQITLSDGTKVWLNAASSLTYPVDLNDVAERRVNLEGEAYFEVAKRSGSFANGTKEPKRVPFIVESAGQQVEVLGTHFNISSYQDEAHIKTTLLEGSVKVIAQQKTGGTIAKGFSEILKPGQQAILTANKLDVITANMEQAIAWKNGQFAFQKQSLKEIMRGLARWYNVEVVYDPGFKDILFTGSVSRFEKIAVVLNILELTEKVKFKIEGRRVTVMQ